MIWANLLHLSYNMWRDREVTAKEYANDARREATTWRPYLRCDGKLWSELTRAMADAGLNMVVIDLGDGIRYDSHPEIAVDGAWTTDALRNELDRLRGMGLEPIPKLNFSTSHDAWLGDYARMVSSPTYYRVCAELIAEVIRLFDRPRFFHLGYDEETLPHQRHYNYVVIRQHELWWDDFAFFVKQVEQAGVRPWIWSDYAWNHPEEFYARMPRSVLQSNWFYGEDLNPENPHVRTYLELDRHGFEQVPTGSNWGNDVNFGRTVDFCRQQLAKERLAGFMQTPWLPTLPTFRDNHLRAIEQVARCIAP